MDHGGMEDERTRTAREVLFVDRGRAPSFDAGNGALASPVVCDRSRASDKGGLTWNGDTGSMRLPHDSERLCDCVASSKIFRTSFPFIWRCKHRPICSEG